MHHPGARVVEANHIFFRVVIATDDGELLDVDPPSFSSFTAFSAAECCPNTAATELLELLGAVVRIMTSSFRIGF
jgi:hypothetical protein